MPHLENWALGTIDPYSPPEAGVRLQGIVKGHPNFQDGSEITTSILTGYKSPFVVTESGQRYTLGKPNPEYEKQFPNPKERIIKALSQPRKR